MFLPWSYDLSQMGMTVLFFATFLFGQEVWFLILYLLKKSVSYGSYGRREIKEHISKQNPIFFLVPGTKIENIDIF